ncbi:zinc finger domain-containing protein [Actinopolymorpha rutila]|uniref:DNA-binding phage zinc finger domain-containing protein n=1 Tax=Actinopolymorpha rutila TaxID=446787 RepID=A0A852ZIH2_9ACTN|nr:hypothetical protein [Actinopolymorpha rutila]NYH92911.1 hypothetical protein [Actinopolymorpha rutila]
MPSEPSQPVWWRRRPTAVTALPPGWELVTARLVDGEDEIMHGAQLVDGEDETLLGAQLVDGGGSILAAIAPMIRIDKNDPTYAAIEDNDVGVMVRDDLLPDDIPNLKEVFAALGIDPPPGSTTAALLWPCPYCHVGIGKWCETTSRRRSDKLHRARFDKNG